MPTSIISNTITDPSGSPLEGVRVVARLVPAPAFRTADGSEVSPIEETTTNASGQWSLTLEETAGISPSNSHYEIIEYLPSGPRTHTIQVGASDQSLFAALVVPPPPADGNTYLTQASADARYQQLGAIGGTNPTSIANGVAASEGASGAAARRDHQHALASGLRIPAVCTSSTRPSSPTEGDLIYETDTKKILVRTATAWIPIGNIQIVTSTTRPSTPFEGLTIYETDTDRLVVWDGSTWVRIGHYSGAGRTGGTWTRNANQSFPNATPTTLTFNAETTDSDGFLTPTSGTITIPAGQGGLYAFDLRYTWSASPGTQGVGIRKNAGNFIPVGLATLGSYGGACGTILCAAGDTIEFQPIQNSGGALNLNPATLNFYKVAN
jgi:hypothetical protein